MDNIQVYEYNPETAAELLDQAGWNLNEDGTAYSQADGAVRWKNTEDGPVPLKLTLAYPQGSAAGESLETILVQNLADVGIQAEVTALPADDLMDQYYRQTDPEYDMFFLATNFSVLYDPSEYFMTTEDGKHVWKSFGLEDEELWEKAVAMRRTEPGNVRDFVTKLYV